MWPLLAPTKAGTRVSRLANLATVVDTGTRSVETPLREVFIPSYGGGGGHRKMSYGCPTVFRVTA